jgi:hypothetical protein
MKLFEFVFTLGVVFAVFGFIWGLIELGITLLSAGRQRQLPEIYILKAVKYFFLVDVTFLVCSNGKFENFNPTSQLVFGSVVLLMYFFGKLQNGKNRQMIGHAFANGRNMTPTKFNLKAEIGVISFAILVFGLFWVFPQYASNPISLWFDESISNIIDTPIFGFIFKVIGFFFLINIIFKMVNAFFFLISGKAFQRRNNQNQDDNRTDFDSWEEVE